MPLLAKTVAALFFTLAFAAAANAQPLAQISFPTANSSVDGIVTISGTANVNGGNAFDSYILEAEIGGGISVFVQFGIGFNPVNGGVLGTWNTSGFDEGPLRLRLTVYDENLTSATYLVPVNVDRTPPSVSNFSVTPNPSTLGTVQLQFTASETLQANPIVQVSGVNATFVSNNGLAYTYSYAVTSLTPQGTVPVTISVQDLAGHVTNSSQSFVVDRVPPTAVNDLAASAGTPGQTTLSWTAPTDSGPQGRASSYDIRYANFPINATNFASATAVVNPPVPAVAGNQQTFLVSNLSSNTTYYFAMKSQDSLGNISLISNVATWAIFSDTVPPVTQLTLSGPQFFDGNQYISNATLVGFMAVDNLGGSGVRGTQYILNGGAFKPYVSGFNLSQGVQMLFYQSSDNAGNLEAVKQSMLIVDATPPVTTLTVGQPQYVSGSGQQFVTHQTPLSLSAQDPVTMGVTPGVQAIYYRLTGGVSLTYSAPLQLTGSDGLQTLDYFAQDNVQNIEASHQVSLAVDGTPPSASFVVTNGVSLSSTSFVGTNSLRLSLSALDPSVGGVASGLDKIQYRLDGASPFDYATPISFAPGAHTVEFFALDHLQNLSPSTFLQITVDVTAPVITLISPVAGQQFRAGLDTLTVQFTVTDDLDPQPSVQAVLTHPLDGATVPVTNGQTVDLSQLAAGNWTLTVNAKDKAGNSSQAASGIFTVVKDQLPPRTTMSIGSPKFGNDPVYVSSGTSFSLSAIDDGVTVGDGAGVGVSQIIVSIDGTETTYRNPAAFFVQEGLHSFSYHAVDFGGQVEVPHMISVAVDLTPPTVQISTSGPVFIQSGILFASPATVFSINAQDPLSNDVASGLNRTEFSLDGGAVTAAPATVSLSEGVHTLAVRAADNMGNMSDAAAQSVSVDGTAPQTSVVVGQPQVNKNGTVYVTPLTPFTLTAVDPSIQQVASGVQTIFAALDNNPPAPVTAPLMITGADGAHTLHVNAVDHVQNAETAQALVYQLDQTPPVTTLSIVGGSTSTFLPAGAKIQLTSQDAGAGVATIYYSFDGGQQQTFAAPFTVPFGVHTITYYAVDGMGNAEAPQTFLPNVDDTPPVSKILVGTPQFVTNGGLYISTATTIALGANDNQSGVSVIRFRMDDGALIDYTVPFTVPGGVHAIYYQAVDFAGNVEDFKSITLKVDEMVPLSALSIGDPKTGTPNLYVVGPTTPLSIAAQDQGATGAVSGVAQTFYRIGDAAYAAYTQPFSLSGTDGQRGLHFYSVDNVGNAELPKNLIVSLDNTPPVSLLSMQGGQYISGTKTFLSSMTWISLSAQDPIVNGTASGLAKLEYRADTGDYLPYTTPFQLISGLHHVDYRSTDRVGNVESSQFADLTVDGVAPRTTLTVTGPQFIAGDARYVAEYTSIALSATDLDESGRAGSGVASLKMRIDGNAYAVYGGTFTLTEGRHVVEFFAQDQVGNTENVQSVVFLVDATPPVTTLTITGPQGGQPPHISPATTLSLSAADPLGQNVASGVSRTLYRLADSPNVPFQVYQSPKIDLTGVSGQHTLEFYSEDNLGRKESTKSQVFILNGAAPTVTLISPSSDRNGAAFAFTPDIIPILGSVKADGPFTYTVSVATTADKATTATGGFTDIYKASAMLDQDTLANWKASKLSGWFTVKVTAQDSTGGQTVTMANLFLGDPARTMDLTKGENVLSLLLKQVRSVAVDSSGNFYVGMWYLNGVVRKFSPDGKPLGYLGCDLGMVDTTGLAVDKDGSIYVADRLKHQVVKMDNGGNLIFRLGKKSGNQWLGSGTEKGEFFDPTGVALDKDGNLYVADRHNARIQKFNSSGLFVAQFPLDDFKPLPDSHDDFDSDEDNERCEHGKNAHPHVFPRAIAVDKIGNMYVTDDRHGRIYKLSPEGNLIDVIGQQGRRPGDFRSPKGIVITAQGDIFVADEGNSRIQRLDPDLNPVSVFGGKSHKAAIQFTKPNSIALGADGKLFVTDYVDDELQAFDAPGSQPTQTQYGFLSLNALSSADPTFHLGNVYSFPNPAKAGASPTIHAELGVADRVHLRIYDIAGGLVHDVEITDAPKIVNDGKGAQYAYEYKWDTTNIASGVYVFMIEAQKQGHDRIKKMSKLAVIK